MPAPIEDLALSDDQAIVALHRDDGIDLVTYDREWSVLRQRTVTCSSLDGDPQARGAKLTRDGSRAVIETNIGLFVVDVGSGRHVRIAAPPSGGSDLAFAMHADLVVVASHEGVVLASLFGTL